MPMAQADRIAFSFQIVDSANQIAALAKAQGQVASSKDKTQQLDNANKNLFDPSNLLVTGYHGEFSLIDGNGRSNIVEQDIQDAANRKLQNHFFPNDTSVTVPSLASLHNIWPRPVPFALTYCIGKNYTEMYTVIAINEAALITTIAGYTVLTLPATVLATVNSYITLLNSEVALIVSTDTNPTNKANNLAAVSNINTVILPALHSYVTSPSLTALQTASANRNTFLTTRKSQLNAVLGTLAQNITDGSVTGSGLYLTRYNALALRLNAFGGSLTLLASYNATGSAQQQVSDNIKSTAASYATMLPTSAFAAAANGTQAISVVDPSSFSVGDAVYVMADDQVELQRAVKAVSGKLITLNDVVPSKYTTTNSARIYKDLT